MIQPSNSYEVCYAILLKRPHIDTGMTEAELERAISYNRRVEIKAWCEQYFNYYWLIDHLVYKPYIAPEPID